MRVCGVLAVVLALAGCSAEREPIVRALDGGAADVFGGEGAVTVLVFVRADCPVSNRYAPEVKRLHEQFAKQGVRFWMVYPDPDQTLEGMRKHQSEYGFTMEVAHDAAHSLVKLAGASITPEVAVFVTRGEEDSVRTYYGRIDDWYVDFGKARPEPTVRDLKQALIAALEGDTTVRQHQPAVGCFIEDLE